MPLEASRSADVPLPREEESAEIDSEEDSDRMGFFSFFRGGFEEGSSSIFGSDLFLFEFVMCLQGVDKVLGESGSENIG